MAQLLGRATIRVNGQVFKSREGATLRPGGVVRTLVNTNFGTEYHEGHSPGVIKAPMNLERGMSIEMFRSIASEVVQFQTDTGQIYVISDCFLSNEPEISDKGGEFELEFTGQPAEELLA